MRFPGSKGLRRTALLAISVSLVAMTSMVSAAPERSRRLRDLVLTTAALAYRGPPEIFGSERTADGHAGGLGGCDAGDQEGETDDSEANTTLRMTSKVAFSASLDRNLGRPLPTHLDWRL